MSPHGVEYARLQGLDVELSPLETASGPSSPADIAVAWNVIEHLHEPVDGLRRLGSFLAPHGWLAASVPNAASFDFRVFKDIWYALQVPSHLYHFSERTLRRLLDRAGFRLERVLHQRNLSNYYRSAAYWADESLGISPALARRMSSILAATQPVSNYIDFPLAVAAAALGQTGRMTFWARKVS